jgi:nucleoside-diphosphate-sugar epimerase
MRVLLTGVTGFLGRNVLAALSDRGVEGIAAYRTEPGPPLNAVQWLRADLTDPTAPFRDALRRPVVPPIFIFASALSEFLESASARSFWRYIKLELVITSAT